MDRSVRKALIRKYIWNMEGEVGLLCLAPLSRIFQLYRGGGPWQTLSSTPHHVEILEHPAYERKKMWYWSISW